MVLQEMNDLKTTKRHYEAFRRKIDALSIQKIMEDEKSFQFFDESSVNKNEMKKYKGLSSDDIELIKGIKLKISNFLLLQERTSIKYFQTQNQQNMTKSY